MKVKKSYRSLSRGDDITTGRSSPIKGLAIQVASSPYSLKQPVPLNSNMNVHL
jgi:hypothetical protein